jgi:hypothetical protein
VFAVPGLRLYVGEVEGTPVATGCAMTGNDAVGAFNISTVESERGKGYGAAITARCVIDGINDGAQIAYLQATEMGEPVYERIGFSTIERWTVFESPSDDQQKQPVQCSSVAIHCIQDRSHRHLRQWRISVGAPHGAFCRRLPISPSTAD